MSRPTAGIIVIGDEILKGQIQDTNTKFLAEELHRSGIQLQRIVILPDDIDDIANAVREFCTKFTHVFTCGGVGPTHDDVTFEAIAKAFGQELVISDKIKHVLEKHFNGDLNESILKMAKLPKNALVDYSRTGQNSFPVIKVGNLYVLPGVPQLLKATFEALKTDFQDSCLHKTTVRECFITSSEFVITDRLNSLVEKYKDSVTFGSYPQWTHNYYETKLTVESVDESIVSQVLQEICESMDVIAYDKDPLENANEKIANLLKLKSKDAEFVHAVEKSQEVLTDCLAKYQPEEIAIAFNGGKDCMVLLHLTFSLWQQKHPEKQLQALYIQEKEPFEVVEEFIESTAKTYNMDLITIPMPMKEALEKLLQMRPKVRAILMGTRIGDPGSKGQGHFSPTDGDWPSVMRVNPIMDWNYQHVWTFLRGLTLPYPILYDQGYTSLGAKTNTCPNPHLAIPNSNQFKPAYELLDGSLERAGRGKKPH